MEQMMAYIGRDNEERLELLQDGSTVAVSAVTRAVLQSSGGILRTTKVATDPICIDSDTDPDLIYFDEDNTVLCIKPGLIPDLVNDEQHTCKITIWDALTTNGYAWDRVKLRSATWNICDT
jgi:hypothetical protein